MRKPLLMVALVALLVPNASRGQVDLGLRLGFAPVAGDEASGAPMSDGVKSQVPIQLDGLFRINPQLAVGAYFSYGFVQLASDFCPSGASCSGDVIRLGVEGTYTFSEVKGPIVPWLGVGLGWERLGISASGFGNQVEGNDSGIELNLQVGGDFAAGPQLAFGPFFMLSLAQYGSAELKVNGVTQFSGSISDKAWHEWFVFGIRGKFSL